MALTVTKCTNVGGWDRDASSILLVARALVSVGLFERFVGVYGLGGSSWCRWELWYWREFDCRREFDLSEGVFCCCWPLLVFSCGWMGEASFGDEGLAHDTKPTAIFFATVLCCNGYFLATATCLQRLLSYNGYFLATATFGGGDLLLMGLFAIRRAILTGRNLDIF